jgi:cyclic beta-1,2-glucan synthetase
VPENALLSHDLFEGLHARWRSSRTSSWSTSTRRACSRTRGGSTAGSAATGRSCCGCSRSCRRGAASSATPADHRALEDPRQPAPQPGRADAAGAARRRLDGAARPALVLDDDRDRRRRVAAPARARAPAGRPAAGRSRSGVPGNLRHDAATGLAQVFLSLTFLAFHAFDTAHAIAVTLVRLVVTRRRLLEWETAATTAARAAGLVGQRGLRRFVAEMAASPIIAAVVAAGIWGCRRTLAGRGAVPAALDACARRRLLAQRAGRRARAAARRARARAAAPDGAQDLALLRNVRHRGRRLAAARQLPGERRRPRWRAARRRPTSAWACCPRWPRTTSDTSRPTRSFAASTRRCGRSRAWSGTRALPELVRHGHAAPLHPRYVSTVDSGNLAGALIALAQGLLEIERSRRRGAAAGRPGRHRRPARRIVVDAAGPALDRQTLTDINRLARAIAGGPHRCPDEIATVEALGARRSRRGLDGPAFRARARRRPVVLVRAVLDAGCS